MHCTSHIPDSGLIYWSICRVGRTTHKLTWNYRVVRIWVFTLENTIQWLLRVVLSGSNWRPIGVGARLGLGPLPVLIEELAWVGHWMLAKIKAERKWCVIFVGKGFGLNTAVAKVKINQCIECDQSNGIVFLWRFWAKLDYKRKKNSLHFKHMETLL